MRRQTPRLPIYRVATILALACLSAAAQAPHSGLDPDRLARIPVRMKEAVDKGTIAGAVVLVARHGRIALHEAVGFQDLESRTPMRKDSIFQIMSMTKPITAVAIMLLAEEGRLALVDPVERYLPEFRGQRMIAGREGDRALTLVKAPRPITVRDLLTHTSGMPNMPPPGLGDLYQKMDRTLAEAVLVYSQVPLEFAPGTQWRYSNPGIATLGRIVEVVSGMPFEKFLESRIFQPLGMKDTFLFPPADRKPRIASVYRLQNGKLSRAGSDLLGGDAILYRPNQRYSGPEFAAYSTAADLAAFYEMVRAGGLYQGKRLLSKAAVEVMTQLHTGNIQAGHMPGTGFGLGWEVVKEPMGELNFLSAGTCGHGGAFGTHGYVDKKKDLVGVFLIQRVGEGGSAEKFAFMRMAAAAVVE